MYQITISFQNLNILENTDNLYVERPTLKDAIDVINTYYLDYENNQYWKITGFVIEEL